MGDGATASEELPHLLWIRHWSEDDHTCLFLIAVLLLSFLSYNIRLLDFNY